MPIQTRSFEPLSLSLLALCLSNPATAQTTVEPLPPPPAIESLYATGPAEQTPSRVEPQPAPARPVVVAVAERPADRTAVYEVPAKRAPPIAVTAPASMAPLPVPFRRPEASQQPVAGSFAPPKIVNATPADGIAGPHLALSVPASALVGAVRIGAATGGPSLRNVVPSDIGDVVFTSASDMEPANGWFTRTYRAALKRSGPYVQQTGARTL